VDRIRNGVVIRVVEPGDAPLHVPIVHPGIARHHRAVGQAQLVWCGSVGCPPPGQATANYALITIGGGDVVVDFPTVRYDLASVLRDMASLGMPHELLTEAPARHALPLHTSLSA
jgi:hypothetical protein